MLVQRVLVLAATVSAVILLSSWGWQAPAQATQDEEGNKDDGSGNVALRIAGDKGTPFSGTCSVGEKEHDISGRVPKSFEYDLNDSKFVCEIRKQEDAQGTELNVVLKSENTRSVHRSVGGEDTVTRLVYEDGNVSSSMSSTSTQTMGSTTSSTPSAANDARRGADNQESLADQIQEKVDRSIERAMPQ